MLCGCVIGVAYDIQNSSESVYWLVSSNTILFISSHIFQFIGLPDHQIRHYCSSISSITNICFMWYALIHDFFWTFRIWSLSNQRRWNVGFSAITSMDGYLRFLFIYLIYKQSVRFQHKLEKELRGEKRRKQHQPNKTSCSHKWWISE